MSRPVGGLLAFALLVGTGCAAGGGGGYGAQRSALVSPREGGFEVEVTRDVVSTVGMLAVAVLVDREKAYWSGLAPCEGEARRPTDDERAAFERLGRDAGVCDSQGIPGVDSLFLGLGSNAARTLSDIGLLSMIATPYAVSVGDVAANGLSAETFGIDSLVTTQALSATLLTTAVLKVIARRARPLTYDARFDKRIRYGGDARLSFPSGHTSMSFAAASVTAVMLLERYPGSVGSAVGAAAAYLGAASVGALRIAAGRHFVTDVLVGAALGTALGLALSVAHVKRDVPATSEAFFGAVGQDRQVTPILGLGGAF